MLAAGTNIGALGRRLTGTKSSALPRTNGISAGWGLFISTLNFSFQEGNEVCNKACAPLKVMFAFLYFNAVAIEGLYWLFH